jgi:phospholipase C
VPPTNSLLPQQEQGIRRARPLPYRPYIQSTANAQAGTFSIAFSNRSSVGIAYHVRQAGVAAAGPWSFTVAPEHKADHVWSPGKDAAYDLSVYGPNGWYRYLKGSLAPHSANLVLDTDESTYDNILCLTITNRGTTEAEVHFSDLYSRVKHIETIHAGKSFTKQFDLTDFHNWYDVVVSVAGDATFQQRLAGHLENGRESYTDPAMGWPQANW